MRTILVGIAAVAAALSASAVVAGASSRLLLAPSVTTVRYGDPLVLHGRVASSLGVDSVVLLAHTAGKTAQAVQTASTLGGGAFRFQLAPLHTTVYTVQAGSVATKTVVRVFPRIGLLRDGTVRVAPVGVFAGKPVILQQFVGGEWLPVMRTTVDRSGVARVLHWAPGVTLRAFVPAAGGYAAGTSRVLTKDGGIILR